MIRRALGVLALLVAVLLAPATSSANPLDIPSLAPPQFRAKLRAKLHTRERRTSADSRIELGSKHGYKLMLVAEGNLIAFVVLGKRSLKGGIHIFSGKKQSLVATAYVTHGTATPTRIEGSFGHFGSVRVRFHPSGRTSRKVPRRCKGRRGYLVRYGTFRGHIRFTGENKYVAVRAHRAKGHVRSPRHLRCPHRGPRGPHLRARARASRTGKLPAAIFAERRQPTTSAEVFAFQLDGLALVAAMTEESLGRMAELHYAISVVPGSVLFHDDALTSATLKPSRPFRGTGIYSAAPDGTKTWTGSLSAAFPGSPRLPLTGPEFFADLEVGF
ncbi:MAG: hypothetical protein ACM3N0_08925 [Chloroflexota bacterium]